MSDRARTPIWRAIAQALQTDIAERRYRAGDKLPTESVLAGRFGVNRHTVRRALADMADRGIVQSRRGAGTFVLTTPTDYQISDRMRFHQSVRAAGRSPSKIILGIERRAAGPGEADPLDVPVGAPLCAYHGVSTVDGSPIALFQSLFPLDRLPGLDAVFERGISSVTQALAEVGVTDYRRKTTRLTAVSASVTDALHLNLTEGAPLLRATSVNIDLSGRPIEYGRTFFAGDRVTLTMELSDLIQ